MTALPDHRAGRIRGLTTRLGGIAPSTSTSIVRSRLFIKYVVLFVAVVSIALVANGVFDVYFSYQEQKASLVRIQREQAEAAAGKIGQFIGESKARSAGPRSCPGRPGRSSKGVSTRCGSCARCRPSPNSPRSTPAAMSS